MIQALLFTLVLYLGVNFVGYSLAGSQPAITTELSAGIVASDVTIPAASTTGFPKAGWLYIQGEAMEYTGTTATCPAPYAAEPSCFTGAVRGQLQTIAVSHPIGARVYNEAVGVSNQLSSLESRTSIDQFGETTSAWAKGKAIMDILTRAATWDWPMFEGDFVVFRVFGSAFTIAIGIGISLVTASLLTGSIRRLF